MLWRTHLLAGMAFGLYIAGQHTTIRNATIAAGIAGVAALLPDLDDQNSKVGRIVPIISWGIKKTVGHRGPLHSLPGVGVVSALLCLAFKTWASYIIPNYILHLIIIGYVSHLVMDSFNPQGVPWLWPVTKKHFSIPVIRTGSKLEQGIINPAMLILCAVLVWPVVRSLY